MLTKYRILASLLNAEPLCGPQPYYIMVGRFAAHFRYLVSIRNLANLPYILLYNDTILYNAGPVVTEVDSQS